MPVKRTQIRGIKDAAKKSDNKTRKAVKKSIKKDVKAEANEEKMQVKTANTFKCGGKMKKK